MCADVQHWAGRPGWQLQPAILRLSHDILLEVVSLLDVPSLLSVRQACRLLNAVTRENIIFVRLLKCPFPPPVPASCAEESVVRGHRLHKNWDLAALPISVRTARGDAVAPRVTRRQIEQAPAPVAPSAPPLAYHLPPGADAYPFLKLETFAPFRDPTTKQASFGPDEPAPMIAFDTPIQPLQSDLDLTEATRSLVQAQFKYITQHGSDSHAPSVRLPPLAGNFAATVVRSWHATAPSVASPPASTSGHSQLGTPPPAAAPAPRPTHVSSLPLRAIFAKIIGGGRWGIFVIKRDPTSKGKQRADATTTQPLTSEALASLGKGKAKELPAAEISSQPQPQPQSQSQSADEGAFLVVYDLDKVICGSEGQVAEYALRNTPSTMACRATSKGIVVVLVKSVTTGPGAGSSLTTLLRWDYASPGLANLGAHKTGCMLGAISIAELESEKDQPARTLVAIVHRPRTVMIQDVDSGQRCFVKLGKVQPVGSRTVVQTIHLVPGPRLLALRSIQAEQPVYALEEYEVPVMGETSQPTVPLQRQWIRSPDLQNCTIIEGPTRNDGSLPDLALWAFETHPHRAVTHWLLRPASTESDDSSVDVELGHDPPSTPAVDQDLYAPGTSSYIFPVQKISTSKLSFPHHKVTFASGVRRGVWFERPERSRSGQARGMRGVWAYTAVNQDTPFVRSCTSELPEDVLAAMENNTLGVAFDEVSGRMVAITCGDGYSALAGSKLWVLDYS